MIRINLLPGKKNQREERGKQQLVLLGVILVAAMGANYYGYSVRDKVKTAGEARLAKTKADIAQLDKVIGEVKDITQRKKELEDKLTVLTNLKKNRAGPVKILDAIQSSLPKKVWLTGIVEAGGAMVLEGQAFTHDDLAEFMSSLQNVVDTTQGIGRIVEGNASGGTDRVELADGGVKELQISQVHNFFTNVTLKGATEDKDSKDKSGLKFVKFSITCTANYAA